MSKEKQMSEMQETEKTPLKPTKKEVGGFKDQGLPEPTRYGDWEVGGRCSDF